MSYSGYEKISDNVSLKAEDHYSLLADNKIWFISQKYNDLPKQNWGQRVAYRGGYIKNYDLSSNKWSEEINFDKIVDSSDDLEEVVFSYKDKICVLLYEKYEKIRFHQLAVFDKKESAFTMWNEFEDNRTTINNNEKGLRNHLILADGELPDGNKLLIASVEGKLYLFRLNIDFESKRSYIERTSEHVFDSMLIPIHAATQGPFVIIEYSNRAACSVNWDPTKHQRLIVEQTSQEEAEPKTEIKGEPPKFHFNGAKSLSLIDNNKWLHIAGSTLKGMTGRTFRGEIWLLEFPFSNEPHWKRIEDHDLPPEAANADIVFNKKFQILYVFDRNNGVYKKKIEV